MLAALITLCQARVAHERVRRAAGFPMHPLSSLALRDHRSGGSRRRRGRGGPGAFFTLVKKSKSKEHPWVQNRSSSPCSSPAPRAWRRWQTRQPRWLCDACAVVVWACLWRSSKPAGQSMPLGLAVDDLVLCRRAAARQQLSLQTKSEPWLFADALHRRNHCCFIGKRVRPARTTAHACGSHGRSRH